MATLNQFQQYSQGENTITNNVLLMLSNLYEIHPRYYEEFISGVTEDSGQYEVIPSFLQQVNNQGDGFIDGHIKIKASSIILETKIDTLEWIDKLLKYTKSFNKNEYKLLFHLSTQTYPLNQIEEIHNKLKDTELTENINFHSLTYNQFVDQLKELEANYPYVPQISRLSQHFEEYCINMNLMPKDQHMLRAMACGQSFDLNIKHKFYFDLASRGYSDFKYLGIYKWKAVRYIGLVENMIVANWEESSQKLNIIDSTNTVTKDQEKRLIEAIKDSEEKLWTVSENHRFFLLEDFTETHFEKTSPGGIFRVRYFNLEDILENVPEDIKSIAQKLNNHTWE